MTWVLTAAAVATVGGGIGAIEANQNRQKQKGTLGTAYGIASKELGLDQLNTREGTAESTVQRGLAGGGTDVNAGTPASLTTPAGGGAHTLGGQIGKDLGVQQSLEAQNLHNENIQQLQQVNASADAAEVSDIAGGVAGATHALSTPTAPPAVTPSPNNSAMSASGEPLASAAFGGIDPINPLGRGAWSAPNTTGGANIYSNG